MSKVNINEVKTSAKSYVRESLEEKLTALDAIQIDDNKFAIPAVINGIELFVTIDIVAKNWYATKVSEAFNIDGEVKSYAIKREDREARAAATKLARATRAIEKSNKKIEKKDE